MRPSAPGCVGGECCKDHCDERWAAAMQPWEYARKPCVLAEERTNMARPALRFLAQPGFVGVCAPVWVPSLEREERQE
jgi:hypothetical protein